MLTISHLLEKVKKISPSCDLKKIEKAYNFAKKYHKGQLRKTGEPYIQHPLEVAFSLANFKFNAETYVAAILHDALEDTKISIDEIKQNFGEETAKLVLGVTKLKKIAFRKHLEVYPIENLRKMFLAMAQDLRVVVIKLFDRLHNLKTLNGLSHEQQKRIARETIEIYAPLAYRLGIGELKGQLEDLAFPYFLPREYKWLSRLATQEFKKRIGYIEKAKIELKKILESEDVKIIDIHGRTKHLFSLYKKLKKYNNNINNIYDLLALRVIVLDISDCYKSLGIIHQSWKPLVGRIKDYIAVPKTNGYQSLHTTVITPDEEILEIQIRTQKMHREAEFGMAASWYYQEQGKPNSGVIVPKKLSWINQLIEWQKEIQDSFGFAESLKIDFLKDRIFVFTPKGDIIDLPDESCVVDFAYQVHTDLGNHCAGAIVNDKFVSLDYKIKNGDIIKILTNQKISPSLDWLNFVVTKLAQSRIKNWFKKQNREKNLQEGKKLLNKELLRLKEQTINKLDKEKIKLLLKKFSYKTFDDLLAAIGRGEISVQEVVKTIYKKEDLLSPRLRKFIFFGQPLTPPRAIIGNNEGLLSNLAHCCHPVFGDKIKAFITRSSGASIHKINCRELTKLAKKERGRILSAKWEKEGQPYCLVNLEIQTLDRLGLIHDISGEITNLKINITNLKTNKLKNDIINLLLTLEVKDVDQVVFLLRKLEKIKGVLKVTKK
ncbi:MAG: bifunctional (p)ppGpp synthetase/guanosine-3',5'-bis(diphosphate) 3'-pyrophosphohydrolase [Patescibacteria group bacterium]